MSAEETKKQTEMALNAADEAQPTDSQPTSDDNPTSNDNEAKQKEEEEEEPAEDAPTDPPKDKLQTAEYNQVKSVSNVLPSDAEEEEEENDKLTVENPDDAEEEEKDEATPLKTVAPLKKSGSKAGVIKKQQTTTGFSVLLSKMDLTDAQVEIPGEYEDIIDAVEEGEETKFLINKEYLPSEKKGLDKNTIYDICLFTGLSIFGIIVCAFKVNTREEAFDVAGSLLFAAGFTPFLLSGWSLLTGATKFFKHNLIKTGTSAFLWVIGLICLLISDGKTDTFLLFALVLMEIGVLFFISRMFFLGEDDELTIERLEKQLEHTRKSVGAGLALAYFYNFVKPVCNDLHRDKETGVIHKDEDEIIMEVKKAYNEPAVDHILRYHVMTILIPRDLNDTNIRSEVRSLKVVGHVKKYSTFRPMDQPILKTWKSEKDGNLYCSGLVDIPTVLSSVWDRKKDVDKQREAMEDDEEKAGLLPVDVPGQIIDFQNNLIALVGQYPETRGKIRIISIPPLPFEAEKTYAAIAAIDADLKTAVIQTPRAKGEEDDDFAD